jgi:glutamate synthase (ferredoxin)
MMRVCHLNTCPVGIATQDPKLRLKFSGDPDFVVNFMRFVAEEVRELMAGLGFRAVDEMIGRGNEVLETRIPDGHPKANGLDLSAILFSPDVPASYGRFQKIRQNHELEKTLDKTKLLEICRPALDRGERVYGELDIQNTDRAVGTLLGGEISRRFGAEGLPEDTIRLRFKGSAGQSFGAFVPAGVTMTLEGDSNDYFGKGLSGGKLIVFPPQTATFKSHENVIVGNTVLYGATGGTAFISGMAGERFAVRNSGAVAVVEGVGDHGCEYMTGGRVVILGETGKNFAAGMSGGIAYVFNENSGFSRLCNREMIYLTGIEEKEEMAFVQNIVRKHFEVTQSRRAYEILRGNWDENLSKFVRVIPRDYQRAIREEKEKRERDLQHGRVAISEVAAV